jgi:hypothetical protein
VTQNAHHPQAGLKPGTIKERFISPGSPQLFNHEEGGRGQEGKKEGHMEELA